MNFNKRLHDSYNAITATGTRQDGTKQDFYGNVSVFCPYQNLVKLDVKDGTFDVHCHGNYLTELVLPDSVKNVRCDKELFDYETTELISADIYYDIDK